MDMTFTPNTSSGRILPSGVPRGESFRASIMGMEGP